MTTLSAEPGTQIVLARRVQEDASVTEMGRTANRLKGITLDLLPIVGRVALILIAVFMIILHPSEAAPNASDFKKFVEAAQRWTVGGAMVFAGIALIFFSEITDENKIREKKELKKSITASRHVAKKLGSNLIPVLTKNHVESRVRVDAALRAKLEKSKGKWDQGESDAIGALLFQDLNREQTILSLINDRGLVTAEGVKDALREIETHPTPLWGGAL